MEKRRRHIQVQRLRLVGHTTKGKTNDLKNSRMEIYVSEAMGNPGRGEKTLLLSLSFARCSGR